MLPDQCVPPVAGLHGQERKVSAFHAEHTLVLKGKHLTGQLSEHVRRYAVHGLIRRGHDVGIVTGGGRRKKRRGVTMALCPHRDGHPGFVKPVQQGLFVGSRINKSGCG